MSKNNTQFKVGTRTTRPTTSYSSSRYSFQSRLQSPRIRNRTVTELDENLRNIRRNLDNTTSSYNNARNTLDASINSSRSLFRTASTTIEIPRIRSETYYTNAN